MTGLYFYDERVGEYRRRAEALAARGIGDHRPQPASIWSAANCSVEKLGRGFAWLDTGTPDSCSKRGNSSRDGEAQGFRVACPEEIAYRQRLDRPRAIDTRGNLFAKNGYGRYLLRVAEGKA